MGTSDRTFSFTESSQTDTAADGTPTTSGEGTEEGGGHDVAVSSGDTSYTTSSKTGSAADEKTGALASSFTQTKTGSTQEYSHEDLNYTYNLSGVTNADHTGSAK